MPNITQADAISDRLSRELAGGRLDLTREPQLPSLQLPDSSPEAIQRAVRTIRQIMDVREGNVGSVLDKHLTLRDLVSAGVVSLVVGGETLTGNLSGTVVNGYGGPVDVTVGGGSGGTTYSDPRPVYVTPPTITGLTASAAFKNILLMWDSGPINFANFAYVEVWRAAADNLAVAAMIGTSTGTLYTDAPAVQGLTYYYWVRSITTSDTPGAYNAVSGVPATLAVDVSLLLSTLAGQITESQLYLDLNSRIDLIDAPGTGLIFKVVELETTYGSTVAAATSAANAAASASAAAQSEADAIIAQSGAEAARDTATTQATTATTKASEAATSATAASTSATNAAGSASTASTAATTATNAATAAGSSSSAAATSATNAASSATAAGTSATASETSRVAADSANTSAQGAASAAATSATTATTQATNAGTAASTATTQAGIATTKAGEASTSSTSAATSATNAAGSASTASTQATNAANSATASGGSASAAAGSASTASTKASEAATSASAASSSATTATTKAGEASTSATNAATSATNAAGSASSAGTSATNAANSATAAGGSASAAATSASNAATSATDAGNSATAATSAKVSAESARDAASGSASAAAGSASTASTHATNAGTSASSASASATTATTKASEASTSATAASTSATNAAGSASTATTQAGLASTSATNSGNSATASAASASAATTQATNASGYATAAATSLEQVRAVATGFDAHTAWNFDSSVDGWTTSGATISASSGVLRVTSTGTDPVLVSPGSLSIPGSANTLIRARVKRIAGSGWDGVAYYEASGHSFSGSYYKSVSNTTVLNEWRVVEWDMSSLGAGGTDWVDKTITRIRLDLGATSADVFDVDWVTVGRVAPVAYTAAIQTAASATASLDGAVHSLYTVRTEVTGTGGTAIGGFGLAGTSTAAEGARIDFGVVANRFYVAAPSSASGVGAIQPFVVQTTSWSDNGVVRSAGVYMDAAYIKNLVAVYGTFSSLVSDDITAANSFTAPVANIAYIKGSNEIRSTDWTSGPSGAGYRLTPTLIELPATAIRGQLTATQINTSGLTIGYGAVTGTPTSLAAINSTEGSKLTGIADGATKNTITSSTSAPASPINGDIWVDTNSPVTVKTRVGGAWVAGGTIPTSLSQVNSTEGTKLTGIATGATKNVVTSGTAAARPTGADGDFYFATDTNLLWQKVSGAWAQCANNYTNTNQLTDGASLGQTAVWTSVASRPTTLTGLNSTEGAKLTGIADGATRNAVTYSASVPGSPVDGDLWVDTSASYAVFKLRSGGAWVTGANALTAYNALTGKPVALADINTTESAKLAGIAAGATVGATWSTNLTGRPGELTDGRITTAIDASGVMISKAKPGLVAAPTTSGLYLGSDFMGYYNSTAAAWKTFMDNAGNFYLGGTGGSLQWNGTTLNIYGGGNFTGSVSVNSATWSTGDGFWTGMDSSLPKLFVGTRGGSRIEFDGSSLSIYVTSSNVYYLGFSPTLASVSAYAYLFHPTTPTTTDVKFKTDGTIYTAANGTETYNSNYFTPTTSGIGSTGGSGSGIWVRATKITGTTPNRGDSLGVWLKLDAVRSWGLSYAVTGTITCELSVQLSTNSTGTNVVSTGSVFITAEHDT